MKSHWRILLFFTILLSWLMIYNCSSQHSTEEGILHWQTFEKNEILLCFLNNEKILLDLRKFRFFFVFPSDFYCEMVTVNAKSLPLFFISCTKNSFFSVLLSFFQASQDTILDFIIRKTNLSCCKNEILNLKRKFHESFHDWSEFESFITEHEPNLKPEGLSFLSLEVLIFDLRYIIPAAHLESIVFVKDTKSNSTEYVKFENDEDFHKFTSCGRGGFSDCYKIAVFSNDTNSYNDNFVLKKFSSPRISSNKDNYNEITVFSRIAATEQSNFCKPLSLIIDQQGNGVGYLMRCASFGSLASVLGSDFLLNYAFFYYQLARLGFSLQVLHEAGVVHSDLKIRNILVSENPSALNSDNYQFLLADFGEVSVPYRRNLDNFTNSKIQCTKSDVSVVRNNYLFIFRSDWCEFVDLLSEVFQRIQFKDSFKDDKTLLLMAIAIGATYHFIRIEQFPDSSDVTNERKGTENDSLELYRISSSFSSVDVLYRDAENNEKYSADKVLIFNHKMKYELHFHSKDVCDIPISGNLTEAIDSINSHFCSSEKVLLPVKESAPANSLYSEY